MKKLVLLSVLLGAMPITMMAQDDDLYFVPTKENVAKEAEKYGMPTDTYYAGSTRSADEYNRRAWSRVAPIDSAGNDIIDFSAERGVYPDSAFNEVQDYKYTRRMSRFDDYSPSVAYWEGYRDGRWSSPWYYSSYYSWYDPWYYDPWYYDTYWGWHSPYYYSTWYSPWRYHYGWYGPRYYGWYGPRYYSYRGGSGARWSRAGYSHHKYSDNHRYSTGTTRNYGTRTYGNHNHSLGGYRSSSSSSMRSGGSFGGGSRGGSFGGGGGRSVGGGHSYGGRR